jgi:transcriptional regulator with XRE-family HTH domain
MRDQRRANRIRVGRAVQRLRLLRDLSQETLAERANNSEKHVGQIERGEVNVGLDVLSRLAAALDVDVADFFPPAARGRQSNPFHLITRAQVEQLEQIARSVRSTYPPRAAKRSR